METLETEKLSVNKADLEELSLGLEDRTFVDYFNIFLSLPVFGQHVFYNYMDSEFDFEPPVKQRRDLYLDKREVLFWLCNERLSLFKKSPLFSEYHLSSKLRTAEITIDGVKKREDTDDGADTTTLCKNIMGTATGMLMFRESMRDTCGEIVYRCWKDIEAWRNIEDDVRKMYWKHAIKTKYIHQGSTSELKSRVKIIVFQGFLNFDVIPENEIHNHVLQGLEEDHAIYKVESDEALLQLQVVLLDAMKRYWVPRFILHFRQQASKETMDIMTRPAPGDLEYLSHERRLRCRFMFPTIYQDSNFGTPTSVFVSQTASEMPHSQESLSTPDEDTEDMSNDEIRPVDLFSLWAGPAKDISLADVESTSSGSFSDSYPEAESPDVYGTDGIQSRNISPTKVARSPVPIVLKSYLGGKKRTILGKFPSISNRAVWCLASDAFAASPFRTFLYKGGCLTDIQYLNFWTDVRNYLDTDEHTVDGYGYPLKRLLAHKFSENYLTPGGEGSNIFSESLKNSLLDALSNNNDVSLLCTAQDIVLEAIWGPLKLFMLDDRKRFLKQVHGYRYHLNLKQRQNLDEVGSKSSSVCASDPMLFFQCTTLKQDSPSSRSPPVITSLMPPSSSSGPRAVTSYHAVITEEQMWRAMELTVLCSEYGTSMMVPQYPPKPEQLVDVLHGDYGSLHVTREPAVKCEWLRNLVHPPKIDIATLKVSRKVVLEEIDISAYERKDEDFRGRNRLIVRRNGLVIDRPVKPKSFVDVLTNPTQFDFFKRFMTIHKATLPVQFWRAVEELKDLNNTKTRHIKMTQIMRKYFGKYAKYGAALDCNEDIIRQIPNMEKVTPGILICAQAAVYRSLEKKWYPLYLDTYPPEADSGTTSRTTIATPRPITPDLLDVVNKAKKIQKKKYQPRRTFQLWKSLIKSLVEFCSAMQNPNETQLLELFLKFEVEKEQQNVKSSIGDTNIEKNIMLSSMAANIQTTRIVIRNRLLILNRLPADLRFWMEVRKFQDIVDSVHKPSDTELLYDKARSVINCFFASEVPPRVQVNVPSDMAFNVMNNLTTNGPTRGLFHDALLLLFPILNHYWRRFQDEWMSGNFQEWYIEHINKTLKYRVTETPHPDIISRAYTDIDADDIPTASQVTLDESMMLIHFSLSEGIKLIYPQPKVPKTDTERRLTKHTLYSRSTESVSARKESKQPIPSEEKKDVRNHQAKNKEEKHKDEDVKEKHPPIPDKRKHSKEKHVQVLVKEGIESPGKHSSPDRARRMSQIVETLNSERIQRIQSQNRRFSRMIGFDEVVSAAMQEVSDSGSVFS